MQKIEFGLCDTVLIEKYIKNFSAKNIFLVHGKNSFKESGAEVLMTELYKNYSFTKFSDFSSNPKIEDVIKGINLYKSKKIDLLIAVGGGTAIDIAKLIKGLANHKGDIVKDVVNNFCIENKTPLIAIPTTCGSGSESTHFAVVYINEKKFSFANKTLLPECALVDGRFSISGSKFLRACSGLDALCQSIESHWSVNSTEESRGFSLIAIKKLIDNLKSFILSPSQKSIEQVAMASNLAGRAINISKTTAPHALSYTITSSFGIPHGCAVAMGMPYFIKYNSNFQLNNLNKGVNKNELLERFNEIFDCFGVKNSLECSNKFTSLVNEIEIDLNYYKNKLNKDDVKLIADNLNEQRAKNNPRKINKSHLIDNFLGI